MEKDPASKREFKLFLCSQRVTTPNLEITSIVETKEKELQLLVNSGGTVQLVFNEMQVENTF